jgi:hypothetical protein
MSNPLKTLCFSLSRPVTAYLTFPEIGKVLGEPENTVTRRYHRALHKLMVKLIKPDQDEVEDGAP